MPSHLHEDHTHIPHITIKAGAPAVEDIPAKIGDIFIDTVGKGVYVSTDNTSDGDWVLVSN